MYDIFIYSIISIYLSIYIHIQYNIIYIIYNIYIIYIYIIHKI